MAYGLSASADGTVFPWVFNPPATYWDGASVFIKHVAEKEGGLDKLKGKKIGLIHLDAPYGKEPIPLLESLAKDMGFELKLYPVPAAEMQNQSDRKSTRLNSSHANISYAVFCLKKKNKHTTHYYNCI